MYIIHTHTHTHTKLQVLELEGLLRIAEEQAQQPHSSEALGNSDRPNRPSENVIMLKEQVHLLENKLKELEKALSDVGMPQDALHNQAAAEVQIVSCVCVCVCVCVYVCVCMYIYIYIII